MNRTEPMARIGASELARLVGEALCKEHRDAMDAYLRKVSYFNTQAKTALGKGDFEGATRAADQALDAAQHYDFENFLADRCRRGEPDSSAPDFRTWMTARRTAGAPRPTSVRMGPPIYRIPEAPPVRMGPPLFRTPEAPPLPLRMGPPIYRTPEAPRESCPPGQFFDGKQCRGSVGPVPSLPSLPYPLRSTAAYPMSGDLGSADDYGLSVSIPMARQALEAAVGLHRQRPTAQTKRRVAYLEGLLDDYMKDWEDFKARHQPPPVRYPTGPGQDILHEPPKPPSPPKNVCPDPAQAPATAPPAPEMPKTPAALLPKAVDDWVLQSDGPFEYPTEDGLNKAYKAYQKEVKNRQSSSLKDRFAKYQLALEDYLQEAPLRAQLESLAHDQIQAMTDLATTSGKIQASIKKKVEERGAEMERLWPGWYKAHLNWDIYWITGGEPDWYRELKGNAATVLDLAVQLATFLPYAKGAASQARYAMVRTGGCRGPVKPLPVLPRTVPVARPKPEPFPSIPAARVISSEATWRMYNRAVLEPAPVPQPAGLPPMTPYQKIQNLIPGGRPGELQVKPGITAPPSSMLPPFRPLVPTASPTPSPTEFVPGSDVQKFRITPQGPVPVPMTEQPVGQAQECPPGQFRDRPGGACRRSVTSLPTLPGSLPTGAVPFTMGGYPFHRKALG